MSDKSRIPKSLISNASPPARKHAASQESASRFAGDSAEGWKWTLAWLPVAMVLQFFIVSIGITNAATLYIKILLAFDVCVLARCVIGIVWQRTSRDWRFYCVVQFAIVFLIPLAAIAESKLAGK